MRTIIIVSVLGLAALAGGPSRAEVAYPWCAHYGGKIGGTNCGFSTFEQCQAALSGNGGYCGNNLQFSAGAAVVVQHPRRHYYRHHRHHRH